MEPANKRGNLRPKLSRRLLTCREAAELTGMKEVTWRKWISERRVESVRLGGRAVRIPLEAIEKFIAASTIPAREENL